MAILRGDHKFFEWWSAIDEPGITADTLRHFIYSRELSEQHKVVLSRIFGVFYFVPLKHKIDDKKNFGRSLLAITTNPLWIFIGGKQHGIARNNLLFLVRHEVI